MEELYRSSNLPNFERVVVTKVSPAALPGLVRRSSSGVDQRRPAVDAMTAGRVTQRPQGINVSHDVVLIIPNNGDFESQYETQVNAVNGTLANLVTCTTDCPFNVTTQPTVVGTQVDPKTFCMSYVKDPDLARHYRAVNHNNSLVCVTRCHANYDLDKLTCYNGGACRVLKDVGAVCECKALDATWYLGSDCGLPIKRVAFYAGLVVTLACLVATVSGLIAYVIINRKEQMRKKDVKKKLVNKWLNDEFEWSRSDKRSTGTLDAGHLNPSFRYDAPLRSPHTRQHTDYRQSGRSSPAVSMYRLDGAARGYDASIQHNGFPPSDQVQMRIHRPQIRSSWDV
ncbi:mucin-3A [Syngnathus acus]|uniref:mucin-3A n=1 Tax=Syngnathus acus TaxID=161584 RepID=UPI001885E911|nr:mucin-3A [Syngnathus acus]